MISIHLPSKRPVPKITQHRWLPQQQQQQQQTTNVVVSMMEEAKRRDSIIKSLAAKCLYREGDIVTPASDVGREKYGDKIEVLKICKNYGQYGKREDWPESDNPMIVHFRTPKITGSTFFCTVNYLMPMATNEDYVG